MSNRVTLFPEFRAGVAVKLEMDYKLSSTLKDWYRITDRQLDLKRIVSNSLFITHFIHPELSPMMELGNGQTSMWDEFCALLLSSFSPSALIMYHDSDST